MQHSTVLYNLYVPHPTKSRALMRVLPVRKACAMMMCRYRPSQNIQAKLQVVQYWASTCSA